MINAINHLRMEAHSRRAMSKPNANTITEYAAKENLKLAEEFEFAADLLRKAHNAGFAEGWLEGINAWAKEREQKRNANGRS